MLCTFRSLIPSRETLCENLAITRCMLSLERLKDYVVATLRIGCSIPGTVKCDENTVTVMRRELFLLITHHRVRRPVGRKGSYGRAFARANADCLAPVASVFRRKHQFPLKRIVVALGPSVVAPGP